MVAGVAFYVTEMRAAEPMMPLHVYRNRKFFLSMAMTFLTGLAMFGAMTFLPLFQQTVQGESPTVSGLALTPMMLGVTVTSIVAGQVTTKTGRYKVFPILGGGIMSLGMYLPHEPGRRHLAAPPRRCSTSSWASAWASSCNASR